MFKEHRHDLASKSIAEIRLHNSRNGDLHVVHVQFDVVEGDWQEDGHTVDGDLTVVQLRVHATAGRNICIESIYYVYFSAQLHSHPMSHAVLRSTHPRPVIQYDLESQEYDDAKRT